MRVITTRKLVEVWEAAADRLYAPDRISAEERHRLFKLCHSLLLHKGPQAAKDVMFRVSFEHSKWGRIDRNGRPLQ